MNSLSQLAAVSAIAGGAGLTSFSRHVDPAFSAANPAAAIARVSQNERAVAAMAGGWGTAFITLGTLGLAVPWINAYVKQQSAQPAWVPANS
jgi:hypothetical protein